MTLPRARGSAAVIAMIVLSLTGLTVASYVSSSTNTAAADAAAIAGWRALYATQAGLAGTVAALGSGSKGTTPPQLNGVVDVTTTAGKLGMYTFLGLSAQSERTVVARVRKVGAGRPVVTSWVTQSSDQPTSIVLQSQQNP